MKKNAWFHLIFSSLIVNSILTAEIEEVSITWNAFKCQGPCVGQIEQNLRTIKAASELKVDPAGFATMKWDSNYPFSYEPFRYASAAVGYRISDMRVRVKGTVTQEGRDFYLVSDKDGSRFLLIGPMRTEPGRYSPSNLDTHPLTPSMRDKLLGAIQGQQTLIISGPLLLPSHYDRALIAEQIKVKSN